jgi:O-antigen/teichoic acid export membrane protein
MRQAKLLIRNTLAIYGQKALTVGLGVYGTRLLFQALGDADVGIYNVLGASTALLAMLGSSFTASAVRHLAHALGGNDRDEFRVVFNTTIGLFFIMSLLILVVGECLSLGLRWLTIPPDRLDAAFWVYQSTLVIVLVTLVTSPCSAVLTAHQALVLHSLLRIPAVMLAFLAIWLLFYIPGDRLITFAVLTLGARTIYFLLIAGSCFLLFPDARIRPSLFRLSRVRAIASFAGWTALGGMAWNLQIRGSSILLNLFFGPALNATWTVSSRAAGYQEGMTYGVVASATPAIMKTEGTGNRENVTSLMLAMSKFATFASLLIAVPVVLDIQNVVQIWLENPPQYSAMFVSLALVALTIESLCRGTIPAMQATGDIGRFTRKYIMYAMLPIPVACVLFWLGTPPVTLPVCIVLGVSVTTVWRVYFSGQVLNSPMRQWWGAVVLPTLIVATIGALAALPARFMMGEGVARFLAVGLSFAAFAIPAIWFLGIDGREREYFRSFLRRSSRQ